jgi:hypothetical protein
MAGCRQRSRSEHRFLGKKEVGSIGCAVVEDGEAAGDAGDAGAGDAGGGCAVADATMDVGCLASEEAAQGWNRRARNWVTRWRTCGNSFPRQSKLNREIRQTETARGRCLVLRGVHTAVG